jgi:hypothetical protein
VTDLTKRGAAPARTIAVCTALSHASGLPKGYQRRPTSWTVAPATDRPWMSVTRPQLADGRYDISHGELLREDT